MYKAANDGGKLHLPNFQKKIENANNMENIPNFWQPNAYKQTVAKVDNGAGLLDDLSRFVLERAHIEKKYAQMLSNWSKKWNDKISRSAEDPEGSLKPAWKSLLSEANQLSVVHANNDQRLRETVQKEVTTWKKTIYQRSLRTWKVTKETHEMFHKAQKPWSKGLKASKKAKKAYFSACEAKDQAVKKLQTAQDTDSTAEEEVQKIEAKVDKSTAAVEETKKVYEDSIAFLQEDRPRYEQDMKKAYNYCEDLEQRRQEFFKEMFLRYHSILSEHTPHQTEQMKQMVDRVHPDADILRYRRHRGPEMPLCVPPFQEFGAKPVIELVVDESSSSHLTMSTTDIIQDEDTDSDWDDEEWTPPPDVNVGRPVRAIYDYVAEEAEEISLRVGDIITLVSRCSCVFACIHWCLCICVTVPFLMFDVCVCTYGRLKRRTNRVGVKESVQTDQRVFSPHVMWKTLRTKRERVQQTLQP
eukprot:m.93295 g.93295  ORF g.93295 m.93295 type:complete len:470 (+) comp12383_c0_seq1:295-1704(+)